MLLKHTPKHIFPDTVLQHGSVELSIFFPDVQLRLYVVFFQSNSAGVMAAQFMPSTLY